MTSEISDFGRPGGARARVMAPRKSGLDSTNFDRTVRRQDDLFRAVNGGWLSLIMMSFSFGGAAADGRRRLALTDILVRVWSW
jgi:hypothetical protein